MPDLAGMPEVCALEAPALDITPPLLILSCKNDSTSSETKLAGISPCWSVTEVLRTLWKMEKLRTSGKMKKGIWKHWHNG